MKAEIIYFSATGTTKQIVEAFADGLNCTTQFIDITPRRNRQDPLCLNSDLVVIAVPIYGERIPRIIEDYLIKIIGEKYPLVVISVYGNMGYGISPVQFEQFSKSNHLQLIAAGTFIAEHTYANEKIDVAFGRPDETDLAEAKKFGQMVSEKYHNKSYGSIIIPKPTVPKFITKFPDGGTRFLIKQPIVDNKLCNHCGACIKKCPMDAIDANTLQIDENKCLRCFACVKVCPKSARRSEFRMKIFGLIFRTLGRKRKENQIII